MDFDDYFALGLAATTIVVFLSMAAAFFAAHTPAQLGDVTNIIARSAAIANGTAPWMWPDHPSATSRSASSSFSGAQSASHRKP